MTETDVRNEAVDEAETDRLARKIFKGIGIALWVTAVIIAVINSLMRFDMAEKIEDYTIVKGKVTEINRTYKTDRFAFVRIERGEGGLFHQICNIEDFLIRSRQRKRGMAGVTGSGKIKDHGNLLLLQ